MGGQHPGQLVLGPGQAVCQPLGPGPQNCLAVGVLQPLGERNACQAGCPPPQASEDVPVVGAHTPPDRRHHVGREASASCPFDRWRASGPLELSLPCLPCLPVRWWCGGFRACGSCVVHACYMPELVLHDIGLVLVHGVMRVAPSAAPHELLSTTPHWGAGVGCIPSQMLKTELTCVMHCSRSLVGHLVAPKPCVVPLP